MCVACINYSHHKPPVTDIPCRPLNAPKANRNTNTSHLSLHNFTVISAVDEREAVMSCLMLGAVDYMVKPLRQNELRHIWTRVWLWQKVSLTTLPLVSGVTRLVSGLRKAWKQRFNSLLLLAPRTLPEVRETACLIHIT